MAHLAVTVALLFLACAYASPAPEPAKPKLTFLKDSALGGALATEQGKAHGVFDSNVGVESPVDTGDNVPDVTFAENVNTGIAAAHGRSVATGLLKNNKFASDPTKPKEGKTLAGSPPKTTKRISPEPANPKLTFLKDSALGGALATEQGRAHGVVDSNVGVESPVDTEDKEERDVALVENVNTGFAFAYSGSVATGLLKNNKFVSDPTKPKEEKPLAGFLPFGFQ